MQIETSALSAPLHGEPVVHPILAVEDQIEMESRLDCTVLAEHESCASRPTWPSISAQNNGPISPNREYKQYGVLCFGDFGGPGSRQALKLGVHTPCRPHEA